VNIIIKSSKHNLKFANIGKQNDIHSFLKEYNDAVWWFIDYFWDNKISYISHGKTYTLDIKNNKLFVPKFISLVGINHGFDLSARAMLIAATEALSIIKSIIINIIYSVKLK
jgi:hypothetical protein